VGADKVLYRTLPQGTSDECRLVPKTGETNHVIWDLLGHEAHVSYSLLLCLSQFVVIVSRAPVVT